jgi:hypothetical protein
MLGQPGQLEPVPRFVPFVRGHAPAPISWLIKVSCDGIYLCVSTVKSLTPNAKVSKQTKAATLASRECS